MLMKDGNGCGICVYWKQMCVLLLTNSATIFFLRKKINNKGIICELTACVYGYALRFFCPLCIKIVEIMIIMFQSMKCTIVLHWLIYKDKSHSKLHFTFGFIQGCHLYLHKEEHTQWTHILKIKKTVYISTWYLYQLLNFIRKREKRSS